MYNDFDDPAFPPDTVLLTLRGVYDGWSIAVLPDGTKVNRWDPVKYPKRYAETQNYLNRHKDPKNV